MTANSNRACSCRPGAYAVFKINSAEAAWGIISGDIHNQKDLMALLKDYFSINNVEPKGNVVIIDNGDGTYEIATNTFEFEQGIASDTWVIEHNLNKYPTVVLVDSAGRQFYGEVVYNSKNQVTVLINGATKGKAYLN